MSSLVGGSASLQTNSIKPKPVLLTKTPADAHQSDVIARLEKGMLIVSNSFMKCIDG